MSGPRNAEDRLRRLLVMLPWLMETGEVPLAEVARRFDMTEAQVQNDLELVAMCGLPPFIDEMIDVFVDDGVVFVGVPRLFTRSAAAHRARGVLAARVGAYGDATARRRPRRRARARAGQARRRPGRRRDRHHQRPTTPPASSSTSHAPTSPTCSPNRPRPVRSWRSPTSRRREPRCPAGRSSRVTCTPTAATGTWSPTTTVRFAPNVPCRPDRVGRGDRPDGRGRGDLAARAVLRRRRPAEGDDPVRSGCPMGVGSVPRRRGRRVGRRMGRGSTAGGQRTMVGQVADPARPRRRARRAGERESCRRGRPHGARPLRRGVSAQRT